MANTMPQHATQGRPEAIEAILAGKILATLNAVSATTTEPVPTTPPKLFVLARGLSNFSLKAWQNTGGNSIVIDPSQLAGKSPHNSATYGLDVSGGRLTQPVRFHGVYPVFARANPQAEQIIGLPSPPLARQVDTLIALLSAVDSVRYTAVVSPTKIEPPKSTPDLMYSDYATIVVRGKHVALDPDFGTGLSILYPKRADFDIGRNGAELEISGHPGALQRLLELNPALKLASGKLDLPARRPLPQRTTSSTLFIDSASVTVDQGLPSSLYFPRGADFMIARSGTNIEISGETANVNRLVTLNQPLLRAGQTRYRLEKPSF